jgi:hypothetical protein
MRNICVGESVGADLEYFESLRRYISKVTASVCSYSRLGGLFEHFKLDVCLLKVNDSNMTGPEIYN